MENKRKERAEIIKNALNDAKAWEELPTSIDGISIVKTPSKKGFGTVMLAINPKNDEGKPIKRKALYLKDCSELKLFLDTLGNKALHEVLKVVEEINGTQKEPKKDVVQL